VYFLGKKLVTKRTILNLLVLHKPTLMDISRQLGKSPSTIKQHLKELQAMGIIRHVNETHLGKYKYYECVPFGALEGHGIGTASRLENGVRQQVRPIPAR